VPEGGKVSTMGPEDFHAPPWDAPLDVNAELEAIPKAATMKGILILPMLAEARRAGVVLRSARNRYLPFVDYPLVEHARLLVESAQAFYPGLALRRGLRKLGRAAPRAFAQATVGRVLWAGVDNAESAIEMIAKSYAIASPSARVTIAERAPGRARIRLDGAHCFRDSHHVGLFEGVLLSVNTKCTVEIRMESPNVWEYQLTWPLRSVRPTVG
jgi:uncharacterized protein (TIGR02265 family)